MLGSIDTGGFSEASKAAMMDSDYFNKRKSSNPFSRGFNFLQDQISKLNTKDDDKENDNDFLKEYLKKTYMPEKKSSRDELADLLTSRLSGGLGGLGGLGGGGGFKLGDDFAIRYPNQQQPQVVDPGRPASGGIQGGISGAAQGFLASGFNPLGAVVGGIGGLFG